MVTLAAALIIASCGGGASSRSPAASTAVDGSASPGAIAEPGAAGNGLSSIGAGLQGRAGLTASVYATGIRQASAFAFDSQGRLWVATAAYTDTGQDGVFLVASVGATPVEVISGLHTALGLIWLGNALYVAAAGGVIAYTGLTGTAFVAHHIVLNLPSGVGEVNELVLGPDGRLHLGVSAPCDHCVPALADSAAVLSFLPDGSDLRVDANGIRAPVGLAYYPATSDLFVTMNQRDDLGDQTPGDWLAVVANGSAWGYPDCYGQGGAACTGAPGPVVVLDKHAAVSGVAIVTGQLGTAVGSAAVVAEWSLGRLQQVSLSRSGTTYVGTVVPFVTGITNPVAVLLGPDGALYVGDWTSGTIYRIVGS